MTSSKPLQLGIIGGGARGLHYARMAVESGVAQIVALVDPNVEVRDRFGQEFALEVDSVFAHWLELAKAGIPLDAVVIATPDASHKDVAMHFAREGVPMLLEKPMAPLENDAREIAEVAERYGTPITVCHVLRYSRYSQRIKELVTSKTIGDIVSIEHLEPIGWWHFAHSYVRGNWSKEVESSSMLMAKCSHDLDWIHFIMGKRETKVSSFGSLFHFRPEKAPANAAKRCIECPLQNTCAYSAPRIYERFIGDPTGEYWPLSVVTPEPTRESLMEALLTGPYGRCVYYSDNDAVDHQVVTMEFDDGSTASFTAVAFTDLAFRKTRVFGTQGWIEGDGERIKVQTFAEPRTWEEDLALSGGASAADGHGGADRALMNAFLADVSRGTGSLSGSLESFQTHQLVWAAERSRKNGGVPEIIELATAPSTI